MKRESMKNLVIVTIVGLVFAALLNLVEIVAQTIPWAGLVILPFVIAGLLYQAIKGWVNAMSDVRE